MKSNLFGNRRLSHSQNFLKSPEFVRSLIDKTDINIDNLIVEIGSGKGVITSQLSDKAGRVIGIEIDDRLVVDLQRKFQQHKNVEIIKTDFLKWNLPQRPYKVFSNIPFNMTTDIITKLLGDKNPPETAYLILQDKAAERFIGDPIAKNTQMSILLKPYYEMMVITKIERRQFIPIPRIDAVLVMFKKRQKPLIESQFAQLFRDFVVYGYNQWKPTIFEAFEKVFSPKQRLILEKKIGIREAKPRDLNINQWLTLFDSFLTYVPNEKKYVVEGAEGRLKIQQKKLQKWHRTR